ncbi:MAG: TonB-dependent receptor plug domain-containing protein [Rhodocyclales bacterium]|nr:TonB-dependent receptor plug domain-containing protein [Rhodocyclales bacterium]
MVCNSKAASWRNSQGPLAIAVAIAFGGIHAGLVLAQEGEAKLKEMTVAADADKPVQQRTELGKLTEYTPISGAVVTHEQIEHLQLVNNLLELGKRVPGISMIRNMRIPDGGKLYTENRIDGMRATATNTSVLDEVDGADIERIEVITGPASALYSSGAFGGTISIFTRQPPRDFKATLSQEAGSWGFLRTRGNVGASLADGRVGFILVGSDLDNGGWRKSTAAAAKDAAAEHKKGLTLRTLIRPTDSTKLTLGYGEVNYNYRWAGPIPINATEGAKLKNVAQNGTNLRSVHLANDWQQVVPGTYGQYIDEYKTTSLRLQQLVGERGELTIARTRIINDDVNNGNGGSGGANSVICDNVTVTCAVVNVAATVTNTVKLSRAITETTLAMYRQEFDFAKATAYVGAETIDVSTDSTTFNNSFNALQAQAGNWAKGTMTATGQGNLTKTRETTPFVNFEFSPLDRLRLHVGERFGKIDYKVDDRTATNRDIAMTKRGNVLRLGATWEINKNHLIWANHGETFNPQSSGSLVNSAAVGTAGNVIGAVLTPERGETREIGFRGLFPATGLRYDVTLFDARSNGFNTTRTCTAAEQAALNGGATCTINEAAGQLATRGLESMFNWAATSWLELGATYTNSRVWFTDFKSTTFDFSGKTYQAAPRHKLNLRIGVKPAPGWLVELEGDHISEYFVDNTNANGTYTRPDLISLRASYRQKDWSFWLHAINLTNRVYATRVQLSTVGGVANVQAAQAGQGNAGSYAPLTLRAGVSYAF